LAFLEVEGLSKTFRSGAGEITLFDNLSFRVTTGRDAGLVGASGAGKSTLLHILGALDRPNRGTVTFSGRDVASLTEEAAAEFRNCEIGYAWQFHYLLPEFTALENAAMPLLVRGMKRADAEEQAMLCCGKWAWKRGRTIAPGNFPVASSKGWPWPGRCSQGKDSAGR